MERESSRQIDNDNESDWSLSDVQIKDHMNVEEDNDFDEPHSKVSISAYDDLTQMSKMPAPQKPQFKKGAPMHKIGKIMTFVNEFMVVEATDSMVLDLDNYVFDKDGRILGFVADVFGPVEKPFYSIRLENIQMIQTLEIGQQIMFYEGSRLLGKEQIYALKEAQKQEVEVESQKDSDQEQEKPKPTKRRMETNLREEPPLRRQRNAYETHSMPVNMMPNNCVVPPMWNMQSMPQMPLPPMPNMMSPQQHMYLQGVYKQYYDQMIMFYNRK